MSTLLSLLALTRHQSIQGLAELQTELALESAFANYHSVLWEQYHLLACEEKQVERTIVSAGESRWDMLAKRYNLVLFRNQRAEITGCRRMTDADGIVYMQSVSSYIKQNLLYEMAKGIYNQYEAIQTLKKSTNLDVEDVNTALEELKKENEKEKVEKEIKSFGTSKRREAASIENPLETFQKIWDMGVLELVVDDTEEVSEERINLTDVVSRRTLKQGTMKIDAETTDWLDRVWLQQYLLTYFSCYAQEKEGHTLAYELEYIIGGKGSDIENLKVVVTELLSVRALCNFLYLMSDVEKMEEVTLLADVLAGGNVALAAVVQVGILSAWAFAEGIVDVRALLQDKKIPLLKNKELWTLELSDLGALTKADEITGEEGLSYENYLGILLLFASEKNLSMRSMDVQELTVRMQSGDKNFCMDDLLVQAEVEIKYSYEPVFFRLEELSSRHMWQYEMMSQKKYGYW